MSSSNVILFDDESRNKLLPFTFTRPAADIRVGILTIREKWEKRLNTSSSSTLTINYLQEKYSANIQEENLLINGSICPDSALVHEITELQQGQSLWQEDILIAAVVVAGDLNDFDISHIKKGTDKISYLGKINHINRLWKIFSTNAEEIEKDFALITTGKTSQAADETVTIIGNKIFIEEGAKITASVINTTTGPVYIGKGAEIMEGCVVRGPLAMCEHSTLKMGAKIYGATTVGPHSKVGGEVNNAVIFGYSNKGHDGFLGNAVLGEWVNIGADSNNSNLKNNYAEVKLWDYETKKFEDTGLQFCGLFMGDHAKCGINTMFNTGTVVGVAANVFGAGFPRNFIPSFSWGGANKMVTFRLDKSYEMMENMMKRRNMEFTDADRRIIDHIFNETEKLR